MFAVQQVATIYKGSNTSISYEFLPCAELIVEYIKTGKYPTESDNNESISIKI